MVTSYRFFIVSFLLGSIVLVSLPALAQHDHDQPPPGSDRTETMIMPSISYSSDLGLMGGGSVQRYRLKEGYDPYYSFFDINALVSTQGLILSRLRYNRTETFGLPIRSEFILHGNRQLYSAYFGTGNHTTFDDDLWDDDYYYFESLSFGFDYQGRIPLARDLNSPLEGLISLGVSHFTPRNVDEDQSLYDFQQEKNIKGYDGGMLNYAGTGLEIETRDSELDPTEGIHSKLEANFMNGFLFSDFNMQIIEFETSAYYTVSWLDDTRIAARISGSQTFGDVPFWREPHLGGENTLRGYPLHRFRDKGRFFYNLELRNWLVTSQSIGLRFGAHAFADGGRVLDFTDNIDDLFENHHHTFGGGISYQILDSNMLLRIEAGFSDEMWRLYLGTGFMF